MSGAKQKLRLWQSLGARKGKREGHLRDGGSGAEGKERRDEGATLLHNWCPLVCENRSLPLLPPSLAPLSSLIPRIRKSLPQKETIQSFPSSSKNFPSLLKGSEGERERERAACTCVREAA